MNTFTAKKVRQAIRKRFFENNFCPPPFSPSPSIVDVTADYPFRLQEVIKKSVRAGNKRAVLRYKIAKPKATEKWDYPFELLSARRKDNAKWA